jgi:prephenate dehydratase
MEQFTIGYQGVPGSYSEMAAEKFLAQNGLPLERAVLRGCEDFDTVFEKTDSGEFAYGIVPIENSLAGSVYRNFDLLAQHDLAVIGEAYLHVSHQLIGLPGANIADIREVYSHWQALAQCQHTLHQKLPQAKLVEYFDTAASCGFIKKQDDPSKAAIASAKAANIHGLEVLRPDMQDDLQNYTRFLIIAKKAPAFEQSGERAHKTSVVFSGGDVTGFLYSALGCFASRNINLTKIESRPVPKSPWHYLFYLDFEGSIEDPDVQHAIDDLRRIAKEVKVLGSYREDSIE